LEVRLSARNQLPQQLGIGVAFVTVLASPAIAQASSGLETPDIGTVQVGRGGAWVAKADDPLAAYMNPAAMSFQASGVHLGAHLMFTSQCFRRVGPDGQPVSPGASIPGPGAEGGPEADTCTSSIFPNPQLAAVFRITDRLAIGAAVLGPHQVGGVEWPEEVEYTRPDGSTRTQPSPNRYLLLSQESILLFPTLSVSYAVTDDLAFGAGFVWGIASAEFSSFTESTSPRAEDDFTRDVRARVSASDAFVPGFVIGANWRVSKRFDLGAWYRFSDAIRARTDLELESQYWLAGGTRNEDPCASDEPDCNVTRREDAGSFKLPIPMEAKIGVRYHHPMSKAIDARPDWAKDRGRFVRDGLSQDWFDVELDLTWAHNSMVDVVELRFDEGIPVNGTPGFVPTNGDIPHQWRDVLGVRLGSDLTVLPGIFGLRAGGFFESKMQDDAFLNLDFHGGWKLGLSGGATVRVGPVDISAAYQHVFFGTLDNGGQGAIRALSGDASSDFRSQQIVNGGSFTQSNNEVALGATLRY
jgi:long-chain fatty acid transport protein